MLFDFDVAVQDSPQVAVVQPNHTYITKNQPFGLWLALLDWLQLRSSTNVTK
jgi:hypothetical protein